MQRPSLANASSDVRALAAQVAALGAAGTGSAAMASLCHKVRRAMARALAAPATLFGDGSFDATGCIDLAVLRTLHQRIESAGVRIATRH